MAPSTCCKKSGETCVCEAQAKCSCGDKLAGNCTCDKAATENNPTGDLCPCQKRSAVACNCGRAKSGSNANEVDFTTKA